MTNQDRKNAELIDRYIAAVEHRLPPKGAKDIVAELRAAIADKLEAKEAELGRTATKEAVRAAGPTKPAPARARKVAFMGGINATSLSAGP